MDTKESDRRLRTRVLILTAFVFGAGLIVVALFRWQSKPEPAAEVFKTAQPAVFAPQGCLFLSAREPDLSEPGASGGLLIREILRQAVLIAARDGLGMTTRDATLREPLTAAANDLAGAVDIETSALPGKGFR